MCTSRQQSLAKQFRDILYRSIEESKNFVIRPNLQETLSLFLFLRIHFNLLFLLPNNGWQILLGAPLQSLRFTQKQVFVLDGLQFYLKLWKSLWVRTIRLYGSLSRQFINNMSSNSRDRFIVMVSKATCTDPAGLSQLPPKCDAAGGLKLNLILQITMLLSVFSTQKYLPLCPNISVANVKIISTFKNSRKNDIPERFLVEWAAKDNLRFWDTFLHALDHLVLQL